MVVEEKKQAETAKPERPAPKPQPQETFEEILRKMRALNDEIADETVSHDIDRIGELTSNIFGIVRAHPERREEVRKFTDYYCRPRSVCWEKLRNDRKSRAIRARTFSNRAKRSRAS